MILSPGTIVKTQRGILRLVERNGGHRHMWIAKPVKLVPGERKRSMYLVLEQDIEAVQNKNGFQSVLDFLLLKKEDFAKQHMEIEVIKAKDR